MMLLPELDCLEGLREVVVDRGGLVIEVGDLGGDLTILTVLLLMLYIFQ